MALNLISPPAVEPVSLAELKEFLRVDPGDTSQDNVILTIGMAARDWVENQVKRRLVQQTWRLSLDFFPGYIDMKLAGQRVSSPFVSGSNAVLVGIRYALVLPRPPVFAVEVFSYQDANGNVTNMVDGTDYFADLASNPARLTPPFGRMWPVARVVVNAVQIQYRLGYAIPVVLGTLAASPPNLYGVTASGYTFPSTDVGRPISIPGAGADGGTLNTVIASITSPPSNRAYLRDPAAAAFQNAVSLLVNNPNGNPAHWEKCKSAIKVYAEGVWRRISPDIYEKQALSICGSAADKRY